MTIKNRIDKLEGINDPANQMLLVSPNEDGTFSDKDGNIYTRDDFPKLGRVLIWTPHKPEGFKGW